MGSFNFSVTPSEDWETFWTLHMRLVLGYKTWSRVLKQQMCLYPLWAGTQLNAAVCPPSEGSVSSIAKQIDQRQAIPAACA